MYFVKFGLDDFFFMKNQTKREWKQPYRHSNVISTYLISVFSLCLSTYQII